MPRCMQPLAPSDCGCIAIKKNRFLTLHIIHKCQLYHSKRGAMWGMQPLWNVIVGSKSHSKHLSDDILACKHMYRENWLYWFEVKRTLISQKNNLSVSNGMRSGFVKVTTLSSFHSALLCLGSSRTHQTQQQQSRNFIDDEEFMWINKWLWLISWWLSK